MKLTDNLYFYPEKGFLDCNTYVIGGEPGIIVDPGSPDYLMALVENLRQDGIDPGEIGIIVNTHLHLDHSWGNEAFKKMSGARVLLHPLQKEFGDITVAQTARFFGFEPPVIAGDGSLESGSLETGKSKYELISAPGHSPDSICFYRREEKILICGDVIFEQNTGRVDLPGGSAAQLIQSINELSRLEIEYLLPGHMGLVSGADKVKNNFEYVRKYVFGWL